MTTVAGRGAYAGAILHVLKQTGTDENGVAIYTPVALVEDLESLPVSLKTLLSGENQTLSVMEVIAGGNEYINGAAVTDAQDINLGSVGAAGDLLQSVLIKNAGAGSNTGNATVVIKDGTTALAIFTVVVAEGASTLIQLNGGYGLKSKNGGWKLNVDVVTAGGIANVLYLAGGLFS